MRFLKAFILIRRRKADANSNIRDFCSERDLVGSRTRVPAPTTDCTLKTIYFPNDEDDDVDSIQHVATNLSNV